MVIGSSIGSLFAGYSLGRIGHMHFGTKIKAFHHWIYGVVLLVLGLVYFESVLGFFSFFFGIGLFVSDFKDFFKLRFFGPDPEDQEKRFWHID